MQNYVCPEHQQDLQHTATDWHCPSGHSFPVRRGIPRFVVGEEYAAAFGLQWNTHRRTQLDSVSGLSLSRDRAKRCIGDENWKSLSSKKILECGCGAGRFTEIFLQEGATVTSIDLSSAVEANFENFPESANHFVAQADIFKLPFKKESFDLVVCLGVLQHLPNPDAGIRKLYESVKPGGLLIIDHYRWSLSWLTRTAPLFRFWLRKMPAARSIIWTTRLVNFFFPLHQMIKNKKWAQTLLSRISPLITYFQAFPQFSVEQQRDWALMDTHDSLTDYYKFFKTKGQLRKTLQLLGAESIWVEHGGIGIEARCRKPMPK